MASPPIISSASNPKTNNFQSAISDGSKKTAWPKKVKSYLKRGGTSNPDLTEENLEEFNRINEILYEHRKSFTSTGKSPYYKGLTDSSLFLNRQKLSGTSSPGRESDVASVASSSISSFIVKMQGLSSSCFSTGQVKDTLAPLEKKHQKQRKTPNETTFTTLGKEMGLEGKAMKVDTTINQDFLLLKKKPLRERDSNTQSPPKPSSKPSTPPLKQSPPSPKQSLLPEKSSPPPQSKQQVSSPSSPLQTLLSPTQQEGSSTNKTKEDSTYSIKKDKYYVFADRYRPAALKDFICNKDKARELQAKVAKKNYELQAKVQSGEYCGHFIFEGPTGVGKRTMIWALLREAFGADRVQTREEVKQFVLQDEAVGSIKVIVKISLQHVEISLSEVKGYEKHVIVELIQETITRSSNKALKCNKENCRVIILYDTDKLSTDTLSYIKWQLEKYKGCRKVFFCCTDASKLQPIISLCNVVQLLPPSNEEIVNVLKFIAEQEGIDLPDKLAVRIANKSKNNLRQAIRSFEATCDHNYTLKEDQIISSGWEDDILKCAKSIVKEQSPRQLYNVRRKLQNLIEHNLCPDFIFEGLMEELKKCTSEDFHPQIDTLYKKYKNTAPNRHPEKKNLQQYMNLEEFIAKFMSCYKTSIKKRQMIPFFTEPTGSSF